MALGICTDSIRDRAVAIFRNGLQPVCKGRGYSLHAPVPNVSHGRGFQGSLHLGAGDDLDLPEKQGFAGMQRVGFALAESTRLGRLCAARSVRTQITVGFPDVYGL